MFKRQKREVPGLNTTSTADISFMLLIFFLVTSSMDTDKGLARQLPPPDQDDTEQQQDVLVKERNVLALKLDAQNRLTCNGEPMSMDELTQRVEEFVSNADNLPSLPEKSEREVHLMGRCLVSDRHIITIATDRLTTYEAYFDMQNAIVKGYNHLRNQLARQRFGRNLAQCSTEERDAISMVYPQRISEMPPTAGDATAEKGGEARP